MSSLQGRELQHARCCFGVQNVPVRKVCVALRGRFEGVHFEEGLYTFQPSVSKAASPCHEASLPMAVLCWQAPSPSPPSLSLSRSVLFISPSLGLPKLSFQTFESGAVEVGAGGGGRERGDTHGLPEVSPFKTEKQVHKGSQCSAVLSKSFYLRRSFCRYN